MTLAIGVDVGGTKVAAGVVDEAGRIIAKLKRSTPAASPLRTEQAIADVVTELLAGRQVAAIGLGAAGFVDRERATMLFAPNLAWRDEPLKQRVEERLGREVVVENDANASAWPTLGNSWMARTSLASSGTCNTRSSVQPCWLRSVPTSS